MRIQIEKGSLLVPIDHWWLKSRIRLDEIIWYVYYQFEKINNLLIVEKKEHLDSVNLLILIDFEISSHGLKEISIFKNT